MNKEEIISKYQSICYNCINSRKPASDENTKKGYVGCIIKVMDKTTDEELTLEKIAEKYITKFNEIGEGWVDLRAKPFGDKSGIITNFQLLTLEVKQCSQYRGELKS